MPRERRSKYANDAKDTVGIASQVESLSSSLAQKATKEEVQAVSSGAPKGVYATLSALQTAFPTGNTNIYLVTADGKWYYWNGTAWTAGGTYQGTGIADWSITKEKLSYGVLDIREFGGVKQTFNQIATSLPATTPSDFTGENAEIKIKGFTNADTKIVVKNDNLFNFKTAVVTNGSPTQVTFAYYLNGFKMTGDAGNADWFGRYVKTKLTLKPNTTYRIKASGTTTNTNEPGLLPGAIVYEAGSSSTQLVSAQAVASINKTFTTTATGEIDIRWYLTRDISGTIKSVETRYFDIMLSETTADKVYVDPFHEEYTIPKFDYGDYRFYVKAKANCTISNPDGILNNISTTGLPSSSASSNPVVSINNVLPDGFGNINLAKSHLAGKKLVYFGDSIVEFGNYPDTIASITGMTVTNAGIGGTCMGRHPNTNYNALSMHKLADAVVSNVWTEQDTAATTLGAAYTTIISRLKSTNFSQIDYVVFAYGTNDFAYASNLGTKDDSDPVGSFYGAINYVINKLQTAFPHLKISMVTTMFSSKIAVDKGDSDITASFYGKYRTEFADTMVEAGGTNHVPVWNAYRNSNINKYNASLYLSSDGVHPVQAGYDLLGQKVSSFLKANF
jgi:lysophospholipase L1-like esterase